MTNKGKFNYIVFYWLGFFVFMCAYSYFSKIETYENSVKADAVVIDELWGAGRTRSGPVGGYYAQFQFVYNDSTYISADRSLAGRSKKTGDKITVIFSQGQPDDAKVYGFLSYWFSVPQWIVGFIVAFGIFIIPVVYGQYAAYKREYSHKFKRK